MKIESSSLNVKVYENPSKNPWEDQRTNPHNAFPYNSIRNLLEGVSGSLR